MFFFRADVGLDIHELLNIHFTDQEEGTERFSIGQKYNEQKIGLVVNKSTEVLTRFGSTLYASIRIHREKLAQSHQVIVINDELSILEDDLHRLRRRGRSTACQGQRALPVPGGVGGFCGLLLNGREQKTTGEQQNTEIKKTRTNIQVQQKRGSKEQQRGPPIGTACAIVAITGTEGHGQLNAGLRMQLS